MSVENKDKVFEIMEYLKSANLKGNLEIIGDGEFLWTLGVIFLRFYIDNRETTVLYSRRKSLSSEIGHFHEDTCNVIDLIQDVNSEDKRVHIAVIGLGGSNFGIEQKTDKKKRSWVIVRHYYSEL